jgi:hypothetical protein
MQAPLAGHAAEGCNDENAYSIIVLIAAAVFIVHFILLVCVDSGVDHSTFVSDSDDVIQTKNAVMAIDFCAFLACVFLFITSVSGQLPSIMKKQSVANAIKWLLGIAGTIDAAAFIAGFFAIFNLHVDGPLKFPTLALCCFALIFGGCTAAWTLFKFLAAE